MIEQLHRYIRKVTQIFLNLTASLRTLMHTDLKILFRGFVLSMVFCPLSEPSVFARGPSVTPSQSV